jgi:hypothetical protein
MATSGGSSGVGKKDEDEEALARALQNIELREGELDDVFIDEQELETMKKKARWLAVARVHTHKSFSSEALFETLRYVWSLAVNPEMREVDDNLFTFKFFCLGDWNKVMHQGPWLFHKLMVVIAEYDGICAPAEVPLNHVAVWAQIHSIPELYRNQSVVDQLARRIGHVKSMEMTHKRWYEGDYVRIRASIDVNKPLIRFAPLNMREAGRKMLLVKYEKIGFFCEVCGVLGHDMEECGDGVHNKEDIQYGNWMLAKRRANIGGVPNFRASFPGRFGGRGRGNGDPMGARKRNSGEVFADEDLEDTASSPIKPPGLADMEEDKIPEKVDHAGVARSIDFDEHDDEANDGRGCKYATYGQGCAPGAADTGGCSANTCWPIKS